MVKQAYILAGEPSGDKIAASLMRAIKADYRFTGIGGPLMATEGLKSDHDYRQLQIVGIAQALRHYASLKKLLDKLVDEVCQLRPDVIFTIDAKGFSLRFAKAVRSRMTQEGWQAKLIHVVAPTIWAYGPNRGKAFEDTFDRLLCLFPMEPALFDQTKLEVKFIGHPAAYHAASLSHNRKQRQKDNSVKLLLLPGSRHAEITSLLPLFLKSICEFDRQTDQSLEVSLITIDEKQALISGILSEHEGPQVSLITDARLDEELRDHDIMLAASGTVTLEAALAGLSGLVAYRLNWFVAMLMKWRFLQADPVLPNIILQEKIYPFYFQKQVNAAGITKGLIGLLSDDKRQKRAQKQAMALQEMLMGQSGDFETEIAAVLADL